MNVRDFIILSKLFIKGLVPRGGTTGQILTKNSDKSFDLKWITGGGGGGSVETVNEVIPDEFGNVSLDVDDIPDGTTYKRVTTTEKNTWNGKQDALGYTAEDIANKSTNVTTDGASDTKYPSVKAVKDYADGLVVGLWDDRGSYDPTGNTFPATGGSGTDGAILKGDIWTISVIGTLGGVAVEIGDTVRALVDTPEQTSTNWGILQNNIGYVAENSANKSTSVTTDGTSDIKYPTVKATKDYADTKEPALPATPESPTEKFLDGNRQWHEIIIGSGGYASNLYFTETASAVVPAYKQLSYTLPATETIKSVTVNNTETLIESYIFDTPTGLTNLDAGSWIVTLASYISSVLTGISTIKIELYKRTAAGVETLLFSKYSGELQNTSVQFNKTESIQGNITVEATDYLVVKVYGKTTSSVDRTIYYVVGDGNASYINTPLALRHQQLRWKNDEVAFQHINATDRTNLNNLSGTNSGNETTTTIGNLLNGATTKDSLSDNDLILIADNADTFKVKKTTYLNFKTLMQTLIKGSTLTISGMFSFVKDKIALVGTSTGKTVLSTANTSATNYTQTFPAKNGTVANTDDNITGTAAGSVLTVPTVDGTATGNVTSAFNCGYSSSAIGYVIYLDSSGTWQKADMNTSETTYAGLLAIALEVKASGNALKVALPGSFIYATGFPTLTVGGKVYLSDDGAITQTASTTNNDCRRILGHAVHANKIWFNPSNDYVVYQA